MIKHYGNCYMRSNSFDNIWTRLSITQGRLLLYSGLIVGKIII